MWIWTPVLQLMREAHEPSLKPLYCLLHLFFSFCVDEWLHVCEVRVTTCVSWFIPSFYRVVPRIKLRLSGLATSGFICWAFLLLPIYFLLSFVFSNFSYVYGYVHMSASACGVQRRVSDPLELEIQVVGSCPVCMLGTELGSSAGFCCYVWGHCPVSPCIICKFIFRTFTYVYPHR